MHFYVLLHRIDFNSFSFQPPSYLTRLVGQILVGNSWSYLFASSIPKEEVFGVSLYLLTYLSPIASALGKYNFFI